MVGCNLLLGFACDNYTTADRTIHGLWCADSLWIAFAKATTWKAERKSTSDFLLRELRHIRLNLIDR
jgi:hypothetical protein